MFDSFYGRFAAGTLLFSLVALNSLAEPKVTDTSSDFSNVILEKNGVVITTLDLARYGMTLLGADRLDSGLDRPKAVLQLIENLYVIRRGAALALSQTPMPIEELVWRSEYSADRSAYDAWMQAEVADILSSADFELLAKEAYVANADQFVRSDMASADHILVKPDGRSWDEVVSRVAEILDAIASGQDFNDVAVEYSDDSSVESNRGHLGYFERGKMAPAFEKAVFEMSVPGQISQPVITAFGVHIIRFNGFMAGKRQSYEELKLILDRRVREQATASAKESATLPLKSELTGIWAEYDEELLKAEVRMQMQKHVAR